MYSNKSVLYLWIGWAKAKVITGKAFLVNSYKNVFKVFKETVHPKKKKKKFSSNL